MLRRTAQPAWHPACAYLPAICRPVSYSCLRTGLIRAMGNNTRTIMLSLSARPDTALHSSANRFDAEEFDVAATMEVSKDLTRRIGATSFRSNIPAGVCAVCATFAPKGLEGFCVWLLAAVLGAGVTSSNMASICPSSRSGETDGRSRSLSSRTGLRRETPALVLDFEYISRLF